MDDQDAPSVHLRTAPFLVAIIVLAGCTAPANTVTPDDGEIVRSDAQATYQLHGASDSFRLTSSFHEVWTQSGDRLGAARVVEFQSNGAATHLFGIGASNGVPMTDTSLAMDGCGDPLWHWIQTGNAGGPGFFNGSGSDTLTVGDLLGLLQRGDLPEQGNMLLHRGDYWLSANRTAPGWDVAKGRTKASAARPGFLKLTWPAGQAFPSEVRIGNETWDRVAWTNTGFQVPCWHDGPEPRIGWDREGPQNLPWAFPYREVMRQVDANPLLATAASFKTNHPDWYMSNAYLTALDAPPSSQGVVGNAAISLTYPGAKSGPTIDCQVRNESQIPIVALCNDTGGWTSDKISPTLPSNLTVALAGYLAMDEWDYGSHATHLWLSYDEPGAQVMLSDQSVIRLWARVNGPQLLSVTPKDYPHWLGPP